VTSIIEKAVEVELKKQLEAGALPIKEAMIKMLQSKAGSTKIADGILAALTGTYSGETFVPSIKIDFERKRSNGW
jgi:hypothetical protein